MSSKYKELQKKVNKTRGVLGEIEKCLKEGEGLEKDVEKNAYLIEDRLKRIEENLAQLKELEDLRSNLKDIKEFAEERKRLLCEPKHKIKIYLGAELDRMFKEKGWNIEGKLPELKVGLLTLEFLLSQGQVKIWYGPKIELIDKSKLLTDEVVKKVISIYEDLNKGSFKDEDAFIKLLFEAYGSVVRRQNLDFGASISIIYWLGEIAWQRQEKHFFADPQREHFKNYGRIQFSYDLSCLKKRLYGGYELRLIVASREQTKRSVDNLWVPSNLGRDGTHFASVSFRNSG